MRSFLYIVVFCIMGTTIAQEPLDKLLKKFNQKGVPYISVTELKMHQHQGSVILFDSRERNEFDVSHIPSASYIGYNDFSIENISEAFPDNETPIVVYCTVGIRSEMIAKKLIDAGYTNVQNLYGGICEWKNHQYKIIDSTNNETENVHTYSKLWSKWLTNGVEIYD